MSCRSFADNTKKNHPAKVAGAPDTEDTAQGNVEMWKGEAKEILDLNFGCCDVDYFAD